MFPEDTRSMHGNFEESDAFVELLKACAKQKDLHKGTCVHADILRSGWLPKSLVVANTLVNMYAKCDSFAKALEVLDELPLRDAISWNALVTGYAHQENGEDAFNCLTHIKFEGLHPDAVTFTCILKVCGNLGESKKGREIHLEIRRKGLLGGNTVLGNALLDVYAKCGEMTIAQEVVDEMSVRDIVTWNVLIGGYTQQGLSKEVLRCYGQMQNEGICPNATTLGFALKACGSVGTVDEGERIHAEITKQGLLGGNIVLGGALVDMYVKCGVLAKAQVMLDDLPFRNIITWNTLITGYSQKGHGEAALSCFERMQLENIQPNVITYICILNACSSIQALHKGEQIHDEIKRQGLLEKSILLGAAVVDMYAKCGALAKAQQALDKLAVRDVVLWSSLLTGYAQQGLAEEALDCFGRLQSEGLFPDEITFACILKVCGGIGAVDKGKRIHVDIKRHRLLQGNIVLGNALVDMYAKCGALTRAQQVLDEQSTRDVVTWNALVGGYAQHKCGVEALACFERMQHEGISPDGITFICVLNACSHSSLLDKGEICFIDMSLKYGVKPGLEHHTCMANLFGRAGYFDKSMAIIRKMPSSIYFPAWSALLSACQQWGNVELGRWSFEYAVCTSNMI